MQFKTVSTEDRLPTLWETYFVLIDGRKDIVTMPWILKRVERYPENPFFWLEVVTEEKTPPPVKKKNQNLSSSMPAASSLRKPFSFRPD
jgi:hypothetical protein